MRQFHHQLFLILFFLSFIHSQARCVDETQPELSSDSLYLEGLKLENKGRMSEAISKYEASVRIAQKSGNQEAIAKNWLALGEIRVIRAEYSKAMVLFEDARELGEELQDKKIEADALIHLGEAYQIQNRDQDALMNIQKAITIGTELNDQRILGTAFKDLGSLLYYKGKLAEALNHLKTALQSAEQIQDAVLLASVLREMGGVLRAQGSLEEAVQQLLRGVRIAEDAGLKIQLPNLFNGLALAYKDQGLLQKALEFHLRAMRTAEEVGDKLTRARTLNNLGILYWERGAYDQAIDYLQQALESAKELGNIRGVGYVLNNTGNVYSVQGLNEPALSCYEKALKIWEQLGDRRSIASSLINIGEIQTNQEQYEKAIENYKKSLTISEETGDKLRITTAARHLGNLLVKQELYEQAETYFQKSLSVAKEMNSKKMIALALEDLGTNYLKLQKYARALQVLQESLTIGEQIKASRIISTSAYQLAQTYEKLGDLDQAMELYKDSIEEIESIRGRAGSEEGKLGILSNKLDVYEGLIGLLSRPQTADVDINPALSFGYSERAKARTLLDSLAKKWFGIEKGLSKEQIVSENAILRKISNFQSQLSEASSEEERIEAKKKLQEAETELDHFTLELRVSNPEYAQLKYPQPYGLQQIQAGLDRNTALLEFFVGRKQSFIFALTSDGLQLASLPEKALLEEPVRKFRNILSQPPSVSLGQDAASLNLEYRRQARNLFNQLIAPVQKTVEKKSNWIFVLDGILHYLPFETLIWKDDRLLLEDFRISYAPSATIWANLKTVNKARKSSKEFLAYADPISASDSGPMRKNSESWVDTLGRLRYARQEVEAIASLYPDDLVMLHLAGKVSESEFKQERISDYKMIHFATHAVIDEEFPRRSGIVLSSDHNKGEDGVLQMDEIWNLDLNAQLVVLSACQTGLGKLVSGEGMIGLMRSFFYAGARNVVVSLWNVDDKSTSDLMKGFYQHMKSKNSKVESLRLAKLDMIRSAKSGSGYAAYQNPYYWAPFVLIGPGE